jgi:hypothetical protein
MLTLLINRVNIQILIFKINKSYSNKFINNLVVIRVKIIKS